MNVIRKAVSALGGIFLAALLIAALAPKATRGIAAALVQVTNATANPVATLDNSHAASQIINLQCGLAVPGGNTGNCYQIIGAFFPGGSFTVPQGQTFVITSIEFTPNFVGPGVLFPELLVGNSFSGQDYAMPCAGTTQLHFPSSGIVVPSGNGMYFNNTAASACAIGIVNIQGYLTPN